MSQLRPELAETSAPAIPDKTALYAIYQSVKARHGLIHGKLEARGEYCAIGAYFHNCPTATLRNSLIDEVATVNDSCPGVGLSARRRIVLRWLRWRLEELGLTLPGRRAKQTEKEPRP